MEKKIIEEALERVITSFQTVLYEDDEQFLENMKTHNIQGDDVRKYQHWEWTQGVGLYGFWRLFAATGKKEYLDILSKFYEKQMEIGLPGKNINTVTPLLAMSYLAEYTKNEEYLEICDEWAESIMHDFARTEEGGFQHMTSDSINHGELWDDTLFMTVLFLANMGRIRGKMEYIEEAQYQFLLHAKYLTDRKTGMWYHGWTFDGHHNFAEALWGRGNCWITMAIPEFLDMVECPASVKRFLEQEERSQIDALVRFQDPSGMWHTLVDDPTSYVEASATCGFAYGILRAVGMGIVGEEYAGSAEKALEPILKCINAEGKVEQVSYGTPMGRESKDFYKEIGLVPMPYGQALAILYLMEMLKR